jgi:hypothetical protein
VRKLGVVLVVLLLFVTVGVAYEQSCQGTQQCPKAQQGECDGSTCSSCVMSASCESCSHAGHCDNCPAMKNPERVKELTGTVRYIRSTNKVLKVMTGETEGMLLRVSNKYPSACKQRLVKAVSALKKGQEVDAWYWKCPVSGKYFLTNIEPAGEGSAAGEGTTSAAGCSMGPTCGGCAG